MEPLTWIFLVLFGLSAAVNVGQLVGGVKIEMSQSQVIQNYNVNVNDNQNMNVVNSTILLTNATVEAVVSNGLTNFRIVMGVLSTNAKARVELIMAVTNQTNKTQVGVYMK